MMRRHSKNNICALLLSALLAACNSNDALTDTTAPSHPDGAIELSAGIVEGSGASVLTRAGAETYHAKHTLLTDETALLLRVSGQWTDHTPGWVVKNTTAIVGNEVTVDDDDDSETPEVGTKHNGVTCSPVLYWDDYGTADPANTSTGRARGLTVYGAAIDGATTTVPASLSAIQNDTTLAAWKALAWSVPANQQTSDWADKDLIISNNVQVAPGASTSNDGTYLFDSRASGKLLEFRHAMSKITVNLKAGNGFDSGFTSTEVLLTSNEALKSDVTEWAYTTGVVDVTTGVVSSQANPAAITMKEAATAMTGYNVTKEALVVPGSAFASDNAYIIRINADGNIYYVTAKEIRTAIDTYKSYSTGSHTSAGAYATEAGVNYVINVRVDKTEIKVEATVTDWTTVTAAEVEPKINISVGYGVPGTTVRVNTFSFYRSLSLNDGYSEGDDYKINNYYRRAAELTRSGSGSSETWTMEPVRYWSSHNQHFQFRLVWPNTTTAKKEGEKADPDPDWSTEEEKEYVQKWRPHVEDKVYNGTNYQVIEIWNDPFQDVDPSLTDISDSYHPYPSNLAIARPEFPADNPATTDVDESDPLCDSTEPASIHTKKHLYSEGICATEGKIDLTFRFVMSQVEVRLTTSDDISRVRLEDAKVELVNAYTHGYVKLGDRVVVPDGDKVTDELDYWKTENVEETVGETVKSTPTRFFRSAIVPQPLTYTTAQASTNLRFKVTITNSDGTKDVYYADVEPILNSAKTAKVAPNSAWESGVHYIYNLNVSKTEIKLSATLASWTEVEATQEVWF